MAPSTLGRSYGWRPDLPDQRDRVYMLHRPAAPGPLPDVVDLRPHMPRVVDQGRLGSCTAQAADGAIGYLLNRAGRSWWRTARLATYYWTRQTEGNEGADTGATIRETARTLVKRGAAHEHLWPYITSTFRRRPNAKVENDASMRQVTQYLAVPQDRDSIRQVLADGFPVMIGFMCYESLEAPEVARTGRVPLPRRNERSLGGHAVLIVGYHATFDHWVVRNSWGSWWGDRGYCYMPTEYLTDPDLAGDAWALEGLEG